MITWGKDRFAATISFGAIVTLGCLCLLIPVNRQVMSGVLMLIFGGGSIAYFIWMIIKTKFQHWVPSLS